ncbi:bifunctional diguanylate cyclase/phosphodiesterase [Zooshikella ganghwensis]|uniref:bifunctional diguanylate cyclase/phosphodiesterase n=1 Tax=Zooshikella ganghwensis TaxID=202772 RepID=UPI0003FD0F12|nr:EAL domain-containing protein [Zooshikella ganghwensis]
MPTIKKNIWLAFYSVLLTWLFFGAVGTYISYNSAYNEVALEQQNITLMTANSLRSLLRQYEVVLDILAAELTREHSFPDKKAAQLLMDSAINIDDSMVAFGVFLPNGAAYVASSNVNLPLGYNLLKQTESKATFMQALSENKIVLGRTYYNKVLKSLVLPVRKAYSDKNGKVIFVLSSAVDIKKGFNFFLKNAQENKLSNTYLYREKDRYFQIAPIEQTNNKEAYLYQIPQNEVDKSIQRIEEKLNMKFNKIKTHYPVIINKLEHPSRKSLAASIYLQRYNLWLVTETKISAINNKFFKDALVLFSILFSSLVIIFILFRNIATSEKRKESALKYQATHDYLTNLHNRFYLDHYFSIQQKHKPFSVIFIDMDNFKSVNDSYGHEFGDKILIQIALRLKKLLCDDDLLIRYSGDEFIVIVIGQENVEPLCLNALASLHKPYRISAFDLILSASIGVASSPIDGYEFDEVKRYADLALYESKKSRNTITFFKTQLKDIYLQNLKIEHELKHAVTQNELYMLYQPQIGSNGKIHGVEALIRWKNKKLGFVSPDKFISIAESSGEIPRIGEFVIKQSLQDISNIYNETGVKIELSINISIKQFVQKRFIDNLESSMKHHYFDNMRIMLEVTESLFIEDLLGIQKIMSKLKEKGIGISLDDFGTGYSSLSLLKRLPIDELKIDKSFVDDMLTNSSAYSMVEGIITIAKKLGMSIVAEGVETAQQHLALKKLGCNIFQGYFHSKPLTKEDLKKFIFDQQNS